MEVSEIEEKIKILTLESNKECSASGISGNAEQLYSLLEKCEDDKEKLQQERLKYVLSQLQREREDTNFCRGCLFCRKTFTGNRYVLLQHMREQHNFCIGPADNIVFIHEFLDHLEQMLKELRCLYCEKVFRDPIILKEHMRKKLHKRINQKNKTYDRFYLINYLEMGKTWKEVEEEEYGVSQEEDEKELMDIGDEDPFICLFCEHRHINFDKIFLHMKLVHLFDFKLLVERHDLEFYHQIKLINYIRKKVHEKVCISCDQKFNFKEELLKHMRDAGHASELPDPDKWNQPLSVSEKFEFTIDLLSVLSSITNTNLMTELGGFRNNTYEYMLLHKFLNTKKKF